MTEHLLGLLVVIPMAAGIVSLALVGRRTPQRVLGVLSIGCLLYTSPSPREVEEAPMPAEA